MLLLGVDDTDSRAGGCTTHLAGRLLEALPDLAPAAPPALVRLNPAVPWKTRGNGAVALAFEGGDPEAVLARAAEVVERWARLGDAGTSPAVVVAERAPPRALYEAAVTRIVTFEEADDALAACGGRARTWKEGRGRIGALAAMAWAAAPGRTTHEVIAYRARERWGTPRDLDTTLAAKLDAEPSVFDCHDAETGEIVMAPSSPCPVLWGLRGTDPVALVALQGVLGPERPAAFTLFRTNHASDDHLVDATCATLSPLTAARLSATVVEAPRRIEGGHVLVDVEDATGRATLAAYEPTGRFRDALAALAPGDRVLACGGVAEVAQVIPTVNLEKVFLVEAAPRRVRPPPHCGRPVDNRGGGTWRCRGCGARFPSAAGLGPHEGWYEVRPGARRHLARPLRLGLP